MYSYGTNFKFGNSGFSLSYFILYFSIIFAAFSPVWRNVAHVVVNVVAQLAAAPDVRRHRQEASSTQHPQYRPAASTRYAGKIRSWSSSALFYVFDSLRSATSCVDPASGVSRDILSCRPVPEPLRRSCPVGLRHVHIRQPSATHYSVLAVVY